MKKIVGIHQPNFAPWLGYFYKIAQSDVFIYLDDVQIQKKGASYSNRVTVLGNGTTQYLTVPIKKGEGIANINETTFFKSNWNIKIVKTIEANYGKSNFFKKNFPFIKELFMFKTNYLSEFNINFITEICKKLDIKTTLKISSEFSVNKTSTDRLISLIKLVEGNVYISGKGGDKYQEHTKFDDANIDLIYNELPAFEYPQFKSVQFANGLSIIDAIFNIDFDGIKKIFTKI
ncbi:MAG: hypothetical protein ACI9WV_000217 [Patiriisocius sp.]|jgi:hypothetical protein